MNDYEKAVQVPLQKLLSILKQCKGENTVRYEKKVADGLESKFLILKHENILTIHWTNFWPSFGIIFVISPALVSLRQKSPFGISNH